MFSTNPEEDYEDEYFADDWLVDVDYSHLTDAESKCTEEEPFMQYLNKMIDAATMYHEL